MVNRLLIVKLIYLSILLTGCHGSVAEEDVQSPHESGQQKTANKQISEVWYRSLGDDWNGPGAIRYFYDKANEDYVIVYENNSTISSVETGTIFDWSSVQFVDKTEINKHIKYNELLIKYGHHIEERIVTLENGNLITMHSLDHRVTGYCPKMLSTYLRLAVPGKQEREYGGDWYNEDGTDMYLKFKGSVLKRISFIYKLPEPRAVKTGNRCASSPEEEFMQNYESISGKYVMAKDGKTIFLGPIETKEGGVVIRVKEDLAFPALCEIDNLIFIETEKIRHLFNYEDMYYQELQQEIGKIFVERRKLLCP